MDSYGHYAVDNGLEPVAGEDMIAGTVVSIVDGAVVPYEPSDDQAQAAVGVLAYKVAAGCTATIATDGVVATRIEGAAAVGQWVIAAGGGMAIAAAALPVETDDLANHGLLGRVLVACEDRGEGVATLAAVHLNILPPGVGFTETSE